MRYLYGREYESDFSKWLDRCQAITADILSSNRRASEQLDLLQEEIIRDNNASFACFFAIDFPTFKPYRMQQIIFKSQDHKYAVLFAQHVKNADIRALQKLVLKAKDPKWI